MKLKNKVAVITEGGRGLGRAVALALLAVFLASPESDHLTGYYGTLREYKRLGWKG